MKTVLALLLGLSLLPSAVGAAEGLAETTKVTPLMTKPLSGSPGKEGTMLLVEYAPGASDPAHRHDAHVFVYVLEGSIVMAVRGGEEKVLKAGETFYEMPGDVHTVGRNASKTEAAKFLVFFVKNEGAPLLTPEK